MALPYHFKKVARRYAPWAGGVLVLSVLQYGVVIWITRSPARFARLDGLLLFMLLTPVPLILLTVVVSLATRDLRRATKEDLERCASCGYSTRGLEVGPKGIVECPECGRRVETV